MKVAPYTPLHIPAVSRICLPHMNHESPMNLPHFSQVDVTTPEEHMGDIIGDVNSRRGMAAEP